jgi:hypothetical protein
MGTECTNFANSTLGARSEVVAQHPFYNLGVQALSGEGPRYAARREAGRDRAGRRKS